MSLIQLRPAQGGAYSLEIGPAAEDGEIGVVEHFSCVRVAEATARLDLGQLTDRATGMALGILTFLGRPGCERKDSGG